jgi:probable FeS assembly SUF system protein SufT
MELVHLSRACPAVKIPSGERVELAQGTEVYVTQALGGSFTIQSRSYGGMYRIAGSDADAIGLTPPSVADEAAASGGETDVESQITAALKTCYDPEIPVNIVDLGLVYDTRIERRDDGKHVIGIKMTLTAPGCGMGVAIAADAEDKLRAIESVADASVEFVWEPPWNPRMISEEGRRILGID